MGAEGWWVAKKETVAMVGVLPHTTLRSPQALQRCVGTVSMEQQPTAELRCRPLRVQVRPHPPPWGHQGSLITPRVTKATSLPAAHPQLVDPHPGVVGWHQEAPAAARPLLCAWTSEHHQHSTAVSSPSVAVTKCPQ